MTATSPSMTARLDAALEDVLRRREVVWREPPSAGRSLRMVDLYEQEARLWSVLFQHSRTRVHWRAALVAEVCARQYARLWRRHATDAMTLIASADIVQDGATAVDRAALDASRGGAS
jgi:hypothetical protein